MAKRVLTSKERDLTEQPLSKDGYSSDRFDKLYGKKKNPYAGTDRDRANKKEKSQRVMFSGPAKWLIEKEKKKLRRLKKNSKRYKEIINWLKKWGVKIDEKKT